MTSGVASRRVGIGDGGRGGDVGEVPGDEGGSGDVGVVPGDGERGGDAGVVSGDRGGGALSESSATIMKRN